MTNYESHFWNAERLVRIMKDPMLDRTVALLGARDVLSRLAQSAAQVLPHIEFFRPAASFAAHANQTLNEALRGPRPVELQRVRALLDTRFREHCETLRSSSPDASAMATSLVRPEDGGNPYATSAARRSAAERCRAIQDEAATRSQRHREEAARILEEFTNRKNAAEQQLEHYVRSSAPASSTPDAVRKWATPATAAAVCFLVAWIVGQSAGLAGLLALLAAGAAIGSQRVRFSRPRRATARAKTPADSALLRLARDLLRPVTEVLVRYYDIAEKAELAAIEAVHAASVLTALPPSSDADPSVIERRLDADIASQAEDLFDEVRPGCVRFTGHRLARLLLDHRVAEVGVKAFDAVVIEAFRAIQGRSLAEAAAAGQAGEAESIVKDLVDAARQITGSFSVADILDMLIEVGESDRGVEWFRSLMLLAKMVVRIPRGERIDYKMCPEVHSIGMPDGPDDRHAAFLLQHFPEATLFRSFEDDAIEFLYDVRNLATEQLHLHQLSEKAYNGGAGSYERYLWHFPRRLRAPVERRANCMATPLSS